MDWSTRGATASDQAGWRSNEVCIDARLSFACIKAAAKHGSAIRTRFGLSAPPRWRGRMAGAHRAGVAALMLAAALAVLRSGDCLRQSCEVPRTFEGLRRKE